MIRSTALVTLIAALTWSAASVAQAPASAPAGATGLCRDGTYWTGATKRGACHGHKGVQDWYATSGAASSDASVGGAAPAAAPATAPVATPPAAVAPAAPVAPAATPPPAAVTTTMPTPSKVQAAPGGGPGQVWVNSSTKVYHCPSDRWYGKTKHGEYMSESDAVAQGNRADHGKACSK